MIKLLQGRAGAVRVRPGARNPQNPRVGERLGYGLPLGARFVGTPRESPAESGARNEFMGRATIGW